MRSIRILLCIVSFGVINDAVKPGEGVPAFLALLLIVALASSDEQS